MTKTTRNQASEPQAGLALLTSNWNCPDESLVGGGQDEAARPGARHQFVDICLAATAEDEVLGHVLQSAIDEERLPEGSFAPKRRFLYRNRPPLGCRLRIRDVDAVCAHALHVLLEPSARQRLAGRDRAPSPSSRSLHVPLVDQGERGESALIRGKAKRYRTRRAECDRDQRQSPDVACPSRPRSAKHALWHEGRRLEVGRLGTQHFAQLGLDRRCSPPICSRIEERPLCTSDFTVPTRQPSRRAASRSETSS